jgi:hypothetical protein
MSAAILPQFSREATAARATPAREIEIKKRIRRGGVGSYIV